MTGRCLPVTVYVGPPAGDSRRAALACVQAYAARYGLPLPRGLGSLPGGKPVICPPSGEAGVHLSVSHSGALWVCAVHTAPLGLDVQRREAARPRAALARRLFSAQEQALLEEEPHRFYDIWCAKEAWVKYTGAGIARGFKGFSCVDGGRLLEVMEGARLAWLPLAEGYTACLWHRGEAVAVERL